MKDKETPLPLVRAWGKMSGDCYQQLRRCEQAKYDGDMDWPDYCVLPINAAYTYLTYTKWKTDQQAAEGAAELTACYIWRKRKVIYSFDPDLVAVLQEQAFELEDDDELPAELLMHLPYPCVYIKTPGLLEHTDGFFAWVDYDVNRDGAEFRVQWMAKDMNQTFAQVLHIQPGWTIRQCIDDTVRYVCNRKGEEFHELDINDTRCLLTAIQVTLYLAAENAEVETGAKVQNAPQQGRGKSKKSHKKEDKASQIEVKDVGIRIGNAIRKAKLRYQGEKTSEGTGGTVRPHSRRGHWHHYWTGPMSIPDARKLILKWTAPTFVHADDFDDSDNDTIDVFPVKQ